MKNKGFSYKTDSGIKVQFGPIEVDHVEKNEYKKDQYQAQIRQEVTKIYPAGKLGNSNADLLFASDVEEAGDGQEYTSTRVTWLPLAKKRSEKQIKEQLSKFPKANIWRIISDNVEDVLTEEQQVAADLDRYENIDMDFYEEKFLVRGANGEELDDEQYSQNFFSKDGKKDSDRRPGSMSVKTERTEAEDEVEIED